MDAFADLVRGIRADNACVGYATSTPPWSQRFAHRAELTLCTILRGDAWITSGDGDPVHVRSGDIAIVRGPEPFVVADAPHRSAQITVDEDGPRPGTEADGIDPDAWPGPRLHTTIPDGASVLVMGAYRAPGDVCSRLLTALPPVVVVPGTHAPDAELALITSEVFTEQPGQQVVLDRLLDLLLVCTLRIWFTLPDVEPPAWYQALGDPTVGPALRAIHDSPEKPWTVCSLADVAGVSRATLARRFTALVGEPPLTYLTEWRMTLAADLLKRSESSISSVAAAAGYSDAFAFSTAFKRLRGATPSKYQKAVAG
ncbi:AraC-like DNA-binding protein [Rhodococcus erythropolis]|uniref:AraC family transcriptional regulator n=1 Tax=Rhodococcus erythropolis group TaxID=2840174 RepID=UPI00216A52B1|nr:MULTISPECIES: AraC family transcriptional regulator [Rhodococcus erythropolis group]MCS4255893.1 AraC-like DNA-binding protein [Rhodococcus erythropolis]MCW2425410.1 AraC-like DNA-binding protein [Rhodococcus erythropolis]MDJ0490255.1 AraC family transcriptional regulator [Rhodococcus qingshengii]